MSKMLTQTEPNVNEFTNTEMLLDAIYKRRSIRNFSDEPISQEVVEKINAYIGSKTIMTGPFGKTFKIALLQKRMEENVGTYGYIHNAPAVLAGVANYEKLILFELAYVFHGLVLYLVSQGLATVWVGASFKHDDIVNAGVVDADEIVPAICFFGNMKEKHGKRQKHNFEKIMTKGLKPHKRHPIEDFGFLKDFSTKLTEESAGIFKDALNVAKLSPSAQNKQSWRVVVDGNKIHFYVIFELMGMVGEGFRKYSCPPEYIDIGIFYKQFEVEMQSKGITGTLKVEDPQIPFPENGQYEYIVTWTKNS